HGPDGPAYPGICRHLSPAERQARYADGSPYALRLDMVKAMASVPLAALRFEEVNKGFIQCNPAPFGDIVLARKETPASYHLAVAFDDVLEWVNFDLRSQDLFERTQIYRLLQSLRNLPTPQYLHHGLISDPQEKRHSKRDGAATIQSLPEEGYRAEEVLNM